MTLLLERAQRRPAVGRSCHIFELIGIPVQETLLGLYRKGTKEKIAVAYRDFIFPDKRDPAFC